MEFKETICLHLQAFGCEQCKAVCKQLTEERDAALLQIDAWRRYHGLLSEELESAVGMAYIHGWRSTPEKIEAGKKLRAELGLPDNELDAIIKERASEKRKCEHSYSKLFGKMVCEKCNQPQ